MLEKQNTDDQKTAAGDAAALDDVIDAGAKKFAPDGSLEWERGVDSGAIPPPVGTTSSREELKSSTRE